VSKDFVKTALIGGIGNVLLGDDGVGPYVVRLLESRYRFGDNVEVADLGTPALDLTHRIAGQHTIILVDCVAPEDLPDDHLPGTVLLYRKEDILRVAPPQRLDPHSPALSECLLAAEMLGASPQNVLLVGVVAECCEPGCLLSAAVQESVGQAMDAVLQELRRLDFNIEKKTYPNEPAIWWSDSSPLLVHS
jgi:hydrogenase maturation protease